MQVRMIEDKRPETVIRVAKGTVDCFKTAREADAAAGASACGGGTSSPSPQNGRSRSG
jgi:hypothetical protein